MNKLERRSRRKRGIRKKITGSGQKPRISVFKSNRHLYVQAIDDRSGSTVSSCSDREAKIACSVDNAVVIGEKLAADLLSKNVKEAVFDRNGYLYHGLVKSVAEGVRKGGVKV
jgi:large subunit ribosomal protein L18